MMKIKGRKIAEVISLFVSLLAILLVVIFLSYDAYQGHDDPYIHLKADIQFHHIKVLDTQFILPIKLSNESKRAVIRAKFKMNGDEIEVDYLPGESVKTIYRVFKEKPSPDLEIYPVEYELQ